MNLQSICCIRTFFLSTLKILSAIDYNNSKLVDKGTIDRRFILDLNALTCSCHTGSSGPQANFASAYLQRKKFFFSRLFNIKKIKKGEKNYWFIKRKSQTKFQFKVRVDTSTGTHKWQLIFLRGDCVRFKSNAV